MKIERYFEIINKFKIKEKTQQIEKNKRIINKWINK